MSHSWTDVTSSIPADVAQPGTVSDPHSGYTYNVRIQDGRLIQQETLDGDRNSHRLTAVAAYLIGSGNHARAMVSAENGYLSQLPVGWFPHEGKWKLNPGYELKNHRFDRPIVPGCLACHGGYAKHDSPTRNRYRLPVTEGISCEHCHGPGRQHVAFRDGSEGTPPATMQDPIVNPQRLDSQLASDVCLQCHLQGDVVVYRDGADAFSFRPGERLSDHRFDFLIQTEAPEAFGVASHGSRLMRSRCYTASDGQLSCIQCHDPHRPAADFPETAYDAKCASCHTPESCERVVMPNETKNARGCVRCHMPRRKTREGQHLVFTDHWIRKPPMHEVEDAVPPVLPPNSDVELINPWPEDDPQQAYLGMAYVKLHASMGPQLPALTRGTALLEAALAKTPEDLLARYWLASGQIARYRSDAAIGHLMQLLKERPDWHDARFRLAVAYHQMNRSPEAIAEYEHVIADASDWMEPYPLVVRLHLLMKNPDAADRLLTQQIVQNPDAVAFLNLALARQLTGRPLQECLAPIDNSLALDPRNATAYVTRAYLLVGAGQIQAARGDYRKALQIDPGNREAIAGLRATGQPR